MPPVVASCAAAGDAGIREPQENARVGAGPVNHDRDPSVPFRTFFVDRISVGKKRQSTKFHQQTTERKTTERPPTFRLIGRALAPPRTTAKPTRAGESSVRGLE